MFPDLVEASLKNRLLVVALSIVMMIYGGLTLTRMPVDVFPDLNRPTVTLMTEAGGMAPEEVEQLITFPLETAMNGMQGVTGVRSVSSVGLSIVYATFDWDVDIYRARQMVTERIALVKEQLPEGITPAMGPMASIMGEIMLIALPIDPAKINPMQVREYADWVLRPRLLTIPGVAQVVPIGGEVRQFQVQPNTARMAELDIKLEQIERVLKSFSGQHQRRVSRAQFARIPDPQYRTHVAAGGPAAAVGRRETRPADSAEPGGRGYVRPGDQARRRRLQRRSRRGAGHSKAAGGRHDHDSPSRSRPRSPTWPRRSRRAWKSRWSPCARHPSSKLRSRRSKGKLVAASVVVAIVLFLFLANLRTTLISLTAIPVSISGHHPGVQVLRPVDQHDDAGRPDHRHRRTGRRRGRRRGKRAPADEAGPAICEGAPRSPGASEIDRQGDDGGPVGHRLCDRDHRPRPGPAVLPAGDGGAADAAARDCLHRRTCSLRCWSR